MCLLTLACVLSFSLFIAGAGADDPWSALRARNPPGLQFSLRLVDRHPYRQGELIRIEVKIPVPPAAAGQPPRDIWRFGGVLLDPQGDCGSITRPCWTLGDVSFDKTDPMLNLGYQPEPLRADLNSYVPALKPGRHRAAVLATHQVLTSRAPMQATYGYAQPPDHAVSDTIEFEVIASSPAWIEQTVGASVAALRAPDTPTKDAWQRRRAAAQQLRFLDHPSAWRASLDLLPTEENTLLRGLSATSKPGEVCELMQSRIPNPEQCVSYGYFSVLAQACERAHLPRPPGPAKPKAPPAGPPQLDPEQKAYLDKWRTYHYELLQNAAAALAAGMPQKSGEARATGFAALCQYLNQSRVDQPRASAPPWVPALTREFVQSFPRMDAARQRYLLELFTSAVRAPEVVPFLESVLDRWKPGDYFEAPHAALRALYNIDPARAQARILAELTKPQTWLDQRSLDMWPDIATSRITDGELIEALAAAQRSGGWSPQLRMAALAKYATPRALPRIKAIYESQQQPCQPELMAYFVRVDPAYADHIFHSQPWDMQAPAPPCAAEFFERTPPLAMAPVLEKYMTAFLMHRDAYLKTTAARSLGRYGSIAALPPLWDALRYFHDFWKGKESELAQNGAGVNLEAELRNAVARGRNWLATEADLRILESLCISERCLFDTQEDLRAWRRPLRIEIMEQPDGIRGKVAQYYGLDLAALRAKLAQFPRGTQFVLSAWRPNAKQAAEEIRSFGASRGLIVVSPLAPGQ